MKPVRGIYWGTLTEGLEGWAVYNLADETSEGYILGHAH
jgi:hypothetical protein